MSGPISHSSNGYTAHTAPEFTSPTIEELFSQFPLSAGASAPNQHGAEPSFLLPDKPATSAGPADWPKIMAALEQHMYWVLAGQQQMQELNKLVKELVQNTGLIFEKAIKGLKVEFEQRSASQNARLKSLLAATDSAALPGSNKRPAPSNSQERPSLPFEHFLQRYQQYR